VKFAQNLRSVKNGIKFHEFEVFMEKVKSFVKQNLQLILLVLCGVLVISGILVIVFGGGDSEGAMKALLVIFGIVLIALGCSLLFFAAVVSSDESANFFLYDGKTKSNMRVEDLDFEAINRKMTFVMTKISSSASQVWMENVFTQNNEILNGDDSFVPLIAYKILYDLSERANEGIWNLYLLASPEIIDAIVSALEMNEDGELGRVFKFLYENSDGSYERTKKFLSDNVKYIQNKMVKYVKANINRF
jgi:hypothetical protein